MDAFWLIPAATIGVAVLVLFYAAIRRHPQPQSEPHVLVDNPRDKPAIDPAEQTRDWEKRPCGSYLEALGRRES